MYRLNCLQRFLAFTVLLALAACGGGGGSNSTSDSNSTNVTSYTISVSVSPAQGGSTAGQGSHVAGEAVTLVATPATGYRFLNWTEGGVEVSNASSYTFTASGARSLVANFSLNVYAVSGDVSPAGSGSIAGAGSYAHGASVTLTASPAAGYAFVNWTEGGVEVSSSSNYTFIATGDRLLTAHFITDGPWTLSGAIQVADGTVVDSDVNDPEAAYATNDGIAMAQPVPNPVTVGGYVNQPGSGSPGRSQLTGDASDTYRVTLAANQTITLHIGDFAGADLDLFLGDADGNLLNSSEGVGMTESLTVTAAGTFLIEVYAFSGASNYVMTISQATGVVAADALHIGDEFVPGDVVVRFSDSASSSGLTNDMKLRSQSTGLAAKAGGPGRAMLMQMGEANRASAFAMLSIESDAGGESALVARSSDARVRAKKDTIRVLKALRKRKDVLYAEPNYIRHSMATIPNDQFYPLQWHYPLINLPTAWDITTGNNVTVAVIDTGVLLAHPDLQGQLVPGYDFISSPARALDGDGIDNDADDPGDGGLVAASSFHGTHVAGTIAAATNNATGVAGVAWNASIMPLRALGMGGGTSYDIQQAVRYAAGLGNDSGTVPADRADIINLSLGGTGSSQAEQDTYTQARNQGVIVVAAAGNESTSVPVYPASYNGVVSVSAVDMNKNLAPYSSYGAYVDVAAPGGNMLSDQNGDGYGDGVLSTIGDDSGGGLVMNYRFSQGTSMAAPHMAGVAALMKSIDPALTPVQLDSLLAGGALTSDLGATGRDDLFGHGLIDAHKAVIAAQGAGATPANPVLAATPGSLNLGVAGTAVVLSVSNSGGGALSADPPTDDAAWLTVNALSIEENNLGTYQVTVDRGALASGTYVATITITSSQNTVNVPVIMQVDGAGDSGDAGRHYVLAVDATTLSAVAEVAVDISNGVYLYSIPDVPAGNYQIIAGTDNNNDGYICDTDEACGAFPSLDHPGTIAVSGDVADLDFSTGFAISLAAQSADDRDAARAGYRRIRLKNVPHQVTQTRQ
ncbi:MAG: S8 family serine peptidase [Thiogranum sp.]|nr:S8 family serine peptidase [Thiogranum sp.]